VVGFAVRAWTTKAKRTSANGSSKMQAAAAAARRAQSRSRTASSSSSSKRRRSPTSRGHKSDHIVAVRDLQCLEGECDNLDVQHEDHSRDELLENVARGKVDLHQDPACVLDVVPIASGHYVAMDVKLFNALQDLQKHVPHTVMVKVRIKKLPRSTKRLLWFWSSTNGGQEISIRRPPGDPDLAPSMRLS